MATSYLKSNATRRMNQCLKKLDEARRRFAVETEATRLDAYSEDVKWYAQQAASWIHYRERLEPVPERCHALVGKRDTYRYTGQGRTGFTMHYTQERCARVSRDGSPFCAQHRGAA